MSKMTKTQMGDEIENLRAVERMLYRYLAQERERNKLNTLQIERLQTDLAEERARGKVEA